MPAPPPSANLTALMRPWARRWGLPGLEDGVRVRFNPRLRRSAGRCSPATGEISLHPALASAPPQSLATVLCHELAHVAAYQLHGRAARPHGPEWAELVIQAGHRPSVALPSRTLGIPAPSQRKQPGPSYLHRCPVCHFSRLARRPVPAWRCAECVAAGLDGRLIVSRQNGAGA